MWGWVGDGWGEKNVSVIRRHAAGVPEPSHGRMTITSRSLTGKNQTVGFRSQILFPGVRSDLSSISDYSSILSKI